MNAAASAQHSSPSLYQLEKKSTKRKGGGGIHYLFSLSLNVCVTCWPLKDSVKTAGVSSLLVCEGDPPSHILREKHTFLSLLYVYPPFFIVIFSSIFSARLLLFHLLRWAEILTPFVSKEKKKDFFFLKLNGSTINNVFL